MSRGRPIGSQIRQNIIELLYFLGTAYGYEIYRHYIHIFPKITLRSVYYHLAKGVALEELKAERIVSEKGDFSWGDTVQKKLYSLGPNAKPTMLKKIKEYLGDTHGNK